MGTTALMTAGGVFAAGFLVLALESYHWSATEYRVEISNLPDAFHGFSILHLSDLHGRVGVFSWPPFQEWLAQADLVAITGDLYSPTRRRAPLARRLDALAAPEGVYYVSGNHDYRARRLMVSPWEPGGRLLDNRVVTLTRAGQRLLVAGLPDLVLGQPDWLGVRRALEASLDVAILLSHRPDAWLLPGVERVALILAGHTHGGQVVLPGLGALARHTRIPGGYVAGRLETPSRPVLITSRGLGTSELPIRWGARPEVVRVVLMRRGVQ
ncbi:MAG: metallophosphoesterase [Firmicutes bacterium]|nr:metallophosphoesterase [Bacillota bacterium]